MTAAIELLKVRMQQLATELGSKLEISKRPRVQFTAEMTPPFITALMKIKQVKEYWDKGSQNQIAARLPPLCAMHAPVVPNAPRSFSDKKAEP